MRQFKSAERTFELRTPQFITYLLDNITNEDVYEIFNNVLECVCFNHVDDGRWKQYMRFIRKTIIKQNIKIKHSSLMDIIEITNENYDVVRENGDDDSEIKYIELLKYFYNIGIYEQRHSQIFPVNKY